MGKITTERKMIGFIKKHHPITCHGNFKPYPLEEEIEREKERM
jgi:hypothetical protein